MKVFLVMIWIILSPQIFAMPVHCKHGQVRVWRHHLGPSCVDRFSSPSPDCFECHTRAQSYLSPTDLWFQSFPRHIYQPAPMPWWAYQGNLHYPNLHYPGAWHSYGNMGGMSQHYYDGRGEVFAGKPNIYIESIHLNKKFTFQFTSKEPLSFLATVPPLDSKNSWNGKIVKNDRFEVDDVHYDFLYYDIRLPKEKMQFQRGVCVEKDEVLKWMLIDLSEMKFPAIALQDFEEYWSVKIPDYPYFCIYPQYNQQLDEVLPVSINVEQVQFTRALYVLIPHKKEPDATGPQVITLPSLDPVDMRPHSLIKHETMFKEWGVAFLGH